MPKRGQNKSRKIAVQDIVQVMEIDPVFWKLAQNWKEMRRQIKNVIFQRSLLPNMRFMLELSKAAHKVFQQRGEFSLPHNLQFFAWKLWLKC